MIDWTTEYGIATALGQNVQDSVFYLRPIACAIDTMTTPVLDHE